MTFGFLKRQKKKRKNRVTSISESSGACVSFQGPWQTLLIISTCLDVVFSLVPHKKNSYVKHMRAASWGILGNPLICTSARLLVLIIVKHVHASWGILETHRGAHPLIYTLARLVGLRRIGLSSHRKLGE